MVRRFFFLAVSLLSSSLLSLMLLSCPQPVLAGPNAGGVLAVHGTLSLSYPAYGIYLRDRIGLAVAGVLDCRMNRIDQETGSFTITGYDYAWKYADPDSSQDLHYLIGEDNMRLTFRFPYPSPGAAVPQHASHPEPVLHLRSIPNPASGPLSIGFTVTPDAEVEVSAFDVSGRAVARIFRGRVSSGTHEVLWDGRDSVGFRLPGGVYWIRLQAGPARVTKRMVVLP